MSEMLTLNQFAATLRVSRRSIERWTAMGLLVPGRTPGGQYRFTRRHLVELLQPGVDPSAIQGRLSIPEFASALGVPPHTVESWIASGKIVPAIRLPSGRASFSREQLDRLLRDKAEHPERSNYKPGVASAAPPKSYATQRAEAFRWVQVKLARRRLRTMYKKPRQNAASET